MFYNRHMPGKTQALSTTPPLSCFQLGPLGYTLLPHDPWGEEVVAGLRRTLQPAAAPALRTRLLHLCRNIEEDSWPATGELPPPLRQLAGAEGAADASWQCLRSRMGCTWHSGTPSPGYWSDGASPELGRFHFQLPWGLLLTDIAARGGGLMHGGLVVHQDRALLLLAPPGGGKSTTLATTPADWQTLSDDAALVWPQEENWLASPIPSWTAMTSGDVSPLPFDSARQCRISALIVLSKGATLRLTPLPARDAVAPVYRGLTEYPATVIADLPLAGHLFRAACAMARTLPCWRLELPLDGNCWPLLAERIAPPR